jgi:hypothetical protein
MSAKQLFLKWETAFTNISVDCSWWQDAHAGQPAHEFSLMWLESFGARLRARPFSFVSTEITLAVVVAVVAAGYLLDWWLRRWTRPLADRVSRQMRLQCSGAATAGFAAS